MTKTSWAFAASIILAVGPFVNASTFPKSEFHRFVAAMVKKGDAAFLDAGRARFLDLPAHSALRSKEIDGDQTTDGLDHGCEIVVRGNDADAVIFSFARMADATHHETRYFKMTPDGALDKAVVARSRYADGRVVRGSGRAENIDRDAPTMRGQLQHELDFWLKGKYRKPKRSSAPKR